MTSHPNHTEDDLFAVWWKRTNREEWILDQGINWVVQAACYVLETHRISHLLRLPLEEEEDTDATLVEWSQSLCVNKSDVDLLCITDHMLHIPFSTQPSS